MRKMWALIAALVLVVGCASSGTMSLSKATVLAGELVLAVDTTERDVYAAGLYSAEVHKSASRIVTKVLLAERSLVRAVAAGQDGFVERAELVATLSDLRAVVGHVPAMSTAIDHVMRVLLSAE